MTKNTQAFCRNCGEELPPDHKGPCPHCGETRKDFTATLHATIGLEPSLSASAVTKVSDELPEEERKLWEKIAAFLKENIIVDGFEIGFPSGLKIKFRIAKDSNNKDSNNK